MLKVVPPRLSTVVDPLKDAQVPEAVAPWRDHSLTNEERLRSYREYVAEKIRGVLAAVERVGAEEAAGIYTAPSVARLLDVGEALEGMSPQRFAFSFQYYEDEVVRPSAVEENATAVCSDGQAVSVSTEGIRVWTLGPSGKLVEEVLTDVGEFSNVHALPNGDIVGQCYQETYLWSRDESGTFRRSCLFEANGIYDILRLGGETRDLVYTTFDSFVRVAGTAIIQLESRSRVSCIEAGSDRSVIAGTTAGGVFLISRRGEAGNSGWKTEKLGQCGNWVVAAGALPDGKLFSVSQDYRISLWSRGTLWGWRCEELQETGTVFAALCLPCGKLVVAHRGGLDIWEPKKRGGWEKKSIGGALRCDEGLVQIKSFGAISLLKALPDGGFAVGTEDCALAVYRVNDSPESASGWTGMLTDGHNAPLSGLAVLPNGKLMSTSKDGVVKTWKLASELEI